MSDGCECSGTFVPADYDTENTRKYLLALQNIGKYFKFEWLQESTEWLIDSPN